MALESATFYVDDYKGRHYKVHAVRDSGFGLEENLWCMVYKAIGIGGNPHDYGEMEYEEDYSQEFNLYAEDCLNLDDDVEVETVIRQKFGDKCWFSNYIELSDADIDVPTEDEMSREVREDIIRCKAMKLLDEYEHIVSPEQCAKVVTRMAKFIRENFN